MFTALVTVVMLQGNMISYFHIMPSIEACQIVKAVASKDLNTVEAYCLAFIPEKK
jgi:hypothetical protein